MTFEEANEFYESTRRKLRTYERLGKEMSTHSLECLFMIDKQYKIATCKFFQDNASGTKYYI